MTLEEEIQFAIKSELGHSSKNYPQLKITLDKFKEDNNLEEITSFRLLLWHYVNNTNNVPICSGCNKNKAKYSGNFRIGYRECCSVKCASRSTETNSKRKKTNTLRYGGETPFHSKEIQSKVQENCMLKYGVKSPLLVQEIQEKIKQVCIEKYGVDNISKNEQIKEKKKTASQIKYGTDCVLQAKEVKEKGKRTLIEKFGVDNAQKSEIVKEKTSKTNLERYGNITPLHSDEYLKTKQIRLVERVKQRFSMLDIISIGEDNEVKANCKKCSKKFTAPLRFIQQRYLFKQVICLECNPFGFNTQSKGQNEVLQFILENYSGEIRNNYRLANKKQIDIYLPDINLGIEFNGVYWHCEAVVEKDYHINKTIQALSEGIKLIHIFEDDWSFKSDVIKARILNLLGINKTVGARKCLVKEVDKKIALNFLEANHLQGSIGAKVHLGLYDKSDNLVSLMSFGDLRKPLGAQTSNDTYELLRFCTVKGMNIVGGASKLFNHFIKTYSPNKVISYADRCWSDGNLYKQLNMNFIRLTEPNYSYLVNGVREHRFKYRKDVLIKQGYDSTLTEKEIMFQRKLWRVYDCGSLKYEYLNPDL